MAENLAVKVTEVSSPEMVDKGGVSAVTKTKHAPSGVNGAGGSADADATGGDATTAAQASPKVSRVRRVTLTFKRRRRRPRVFDWPKRNLFEATCLTDEARGSMVIQSPPPPPLPNFFMAASVSSAPHAGSVSMITEKVKLLIDANVYEVARDSNAPMSVLWHTVRCQCLCCGTQ